MPQTGPPRDHFTARIILKASNENQAKTSVTVTEKISQTILLNPTHSSKQEKANQLKEHSRKIKITSDYKKRRVNSIFLRNNSAGKLTVFSRSVTLYLSLVSSPLI